MPSPEQSPQPDDTWVERIPPRVYNDYDTEAIYIAVDNVFLGAWQNGGWRSVSGRYNGPLERSPFSIDEITGMTHYEMYSQNEYLGKVHEIGLDIFSGLGSLFDPYAIWLQEYAKDGGDEWRKLFDLPIIFTEEHRGIPMLYYNPCLFFTEEYRPGNAKIAVSGGFNPIPRLVKSVEAPYSDNITQAVRGVLDGAGLISTLVNVEAVRTCDIHGDGNSSFIIYANTPYEYFIWNDALPSANFEQQSLGAYNMILTLDADGIVSIVRFEFTLITKENLRYSDDGEQACIEGMEYFISFLPIGIFDLNGDGTLEILSYNAYWEWGDYAAYELQPDGAWKEILVAECGM